MSTRKFAEHSLCIAGAEASCISVEHMPWNQALFNQKKELRDGIIAIPDRPGIEFSFDKGAIKRFSV